MNVYGIEVVECKEMRDICHSDMSQQVAQRYRIGGAKFGGGKAFDVDMLSEQSAIDLVEKFTTGITDLNLTECQLLHRSVASRELASGCRLGMACRFVRGEISSRIAERIPEVSSRPSQANCGFGLTSQN